MLVLDQLHLSFGHPILKDVSTTIQQGEVVGIVGASGGGKSSLLKIIAGLLDPDSGKVIWNDQKVKGPSERLIPGHEDIQLVNQDFGLDVYHTVRENIIQKMLYLPNETRAAFCDELLDLIELKPYENRQAISLSGGEQQRLAIARALAVEPDVLLLDEPFAHLDAHLKHRIGEYILQLAKERNLICILVSHEGQDVLEWCDRIYFMNNGQFERVDTPEAFYHHPKTAYEARFFGEINALKINGEAILFRPEAFELSDEGELSLEVISNLFAGAYYRVNTCTSSGENVVLYHSSRLSKTIRIAIRK